MARYRGQRERRTNSIILPRIYLLLEILLLTLLSYISYALLSGIGASDKIIYSLLGVANLFYFYRFFIRCRQISKRNYFQKKFSNY